MVLSLFARTKESANFAVGVVGWQLTLVGLRLAVVSSRLHFDCCHSWLVGCWFDLGHFALFGTDCSVSASWLTTMAPTPLSYVLINLNDNTPSHVAASLARGPHA